MNELMKIRNKIYQKNPDIVFRKIADEAILVPICGNIADMQKLFMLNPVAEFIWQQIEEDTTLDAICTGVTEKFEVSREQAEKDIFDFVNELQDIELINDVATKKKPV